MGLISTRKGINNAISIMKKYVDIFHNGIYPIELFGGKANSTQFDNSIAFKNALKTINNLGGGTLVFGNGDYYFNTPIIIDERLTGIQIQGTSQSWLKQDGKTFEGTTLYYTGDGYFIDFADKMIMCKISNLTMKGNSTNFCMNFLKCFKTIFEDLTFMSFSRSIHLPCFTYVNMNRISILCKENSIVEYGIRVGDGNGGDNSSSEFLIITNSSIDGSYYGTEESEIHTANAIEILGGTHIWMEFLDICNWYGGCGLLIDNSAVCLTAMHNYLHSQITRCKTGIKILNTGGDIGFLTFDGILLQMTGASTSEYGVMINKTNSFSGTVFKNIEWRIIGSTAPEYIIYTDANVNVKTFELTQCINKTSKITIDNKYSSTVINDCRLRKTNVFSLKGDGTTTDYTVTITTNSPFSSVPFISTSMFMNSMEGKYRISKITHINGGNLDIKFTFDEALTADVTYLMYVTISDCGTKL